MKIVIVVEDGYVQSVHTDKPDYVDDVQVYDLDTDIPERLEETEGDLEEALIGTTEIY